MKRFFVILLILVLLPTLTQAQVVAKAYSVQGSVEAQMGGSKSWVPVSKGTEFTNGDVIRTLEGSRAGLKFTGGKLVRLRENSRLRITAPEVTNEEGGKLNLINGVMHLFSRKSKKFPEVETAEVSATIRGTEFVVASENGKTSFSVMNGQVEMRNQHGSSVLNKGEKGVASKNSSPEKSLLANPLEDVQWALHYPLATNLPELQMFGEPKTLHQQRGWEELADGHYDEALTSFHGRSWQDAFGRVVVYMMAGNHHKAHHEATRLERQKNAAGSFLHAAFHLSGGSLKKAQASLAHTKEFLAHKSNPRLEAAAHAQEALIALMQNYTDSAQQHVDKALSIAPDSISGLLAKAYVEQSLRSVEDARNTLEHARELSPDNGAVLARLAEVKLGMGETASALSDAKDAAHLTPHSSYAQTVLGFAHLTRYETKEAKIAFGRAQDLNATSGLPYFGTGLAKIREGNLEEGKDDLAKAVHLEPARGLYRSYLGKAFFEAEDEDLAQEEYEMAISIDANDPTPYLYRAFNHLSQNRPIQALGDIETSIEKNNARAVYRSSSMLDRDLAVRTTSLAEVFDQIGFSEISRLEAIKSINSDYTNYSAHRLLADSYDTAFLGDAQFTEGIIADLLSPVSFNVFQNYNGFSSDASLNDYAALFDRPEHRTQVSGSWQSHDDLAEASVLQTGAFEQFGYRMGYDSSYGDGSKSNGIFTRTHTFDAALQYQPTYEDRFILQSAYKKREDDTIELGTDVEDFEVSLGSSHKLSHRSQVLTRVEYLNRNLDSFDNTVVEYADQSLIFGGMTFPLLGTDLFLDQRSDEDVTTLRGSVQWIFDTDLVDFVSGAQYLYTSGDADEDSLIVDDSLGYFSGLGRRMSSMGDYDTDSYTTYVYSTWHLSSWIDVNAGLNFTEIQLPAFDVIPPYTSGDRSDNKLSPKVGMTFYLSDETMIRSAYFQSLGISSVSDIGTIEPTLVGSFNQLMGDLPGAETENWGIGIDHKIPGEAYFGAEYVYRDIERTGVSLMPTMFTDLDTTSEYTVLRSSTSGESEREHLMKSYLYGVLSDTVTGTLDYRRELLEAIDITEKNETDRVRFGMHYFDPSRWFAFANASWIHQHLSDVDSVGTEEFWLLDTGIGYRLPKRHGVIQLVLRNLLDEEFYFDDRGRSTGIYSEFNAAIEATVNF